MGRECSGYKRKIEAGDECYYQNWEETWEEVCEGGYRATNSPLRKEFNLRFKMRCFFLNSFHCIKIWQK